MHMTNNLNNYQTFLVTGLDLSAKGNNMRKEGPESFVYILTSWNISLDSQKS